MKEIRHPAIDQILITDIFYALSDSSRLDIVRQLSSGNSLTCGQLAPDRPKSSMSHHFKILRDAGLIKTTPRGKEHYNTLRSDELHSKFPGLLEAIIQTT